MKTYWTWEKNYKAWGWIESYVIFVKFTVLRKDEVMILKWEFFTKGGFDYLNFQIID